MLFRAFMVVALLCQASLSWADDVEAAGEHGAPGEQESPGEPGASGEPETPDEKGDARISFLLDETPNFPEVLRDQWTDGIAVSGEDLAGRYFGLLRDEGKERGLSLEQSIALALQNNTGLKIGRLNPVFATAEVRRVRSVFDPEIFANAGKFRSNRPATSQSGFTSENTEVFQQRIDWDLGARKTLLSGGLLSFAWTNSRTSSPANVANVLVPQYGSLLDLSLNQPLLRNFGWKYALLRVDVAQTVEEAAFYEYKAQVANLVSAVEQLYWNYVLAIENVGVQEQGLELAQELLRQNEGRFKVGALPRTSVLESEAEVARREADLVRARALRRIARDNLRAVINFKDPDSDALIMVEPSDAPSLTDFKRDLAASLDSGLHNRPELIAARLNVDSKMLLEKAAQNQLLPRLDFVGSIGLNGLAGSDATPLSFAGDISGPLACADPENPAPGVVCADPRVVGGYGRSLELLRDGRFYQYNFGVQLEIPVGNAAAKAEYTQAKINAERSKLSMRELEENVTLEIKTAVDNLNSLMTSVEATRVARELAEENVRNQRARYDVGLATTKDLIDFSQRLTVARQSEIQSLTTYESGIADLRRAEGSLLEHRNIELYRRPPEEPKWWARF